MLHTLVQLCYTGEKATITGHILTSTLGLGIHI